MESGLRIQAVRLHYFIPSSKLGKKTVRVMKCVWQNDRQVR